ncbi:IclR family transcriptional regulator [Pseudorhodoferax sp. Leaf267]|uniref:IclR family transcriptional regulator n=1 Tax=Pseudorhodoferax sp. Leaf267 TaxID=1736316 RepID=UPI0006F20919|nr:IclR family transcriptional regulator [Pseudorhodoferax sp. Leaf267]KQP19787.1 IclR family transcriptional regulator [Pseudorhodoferax sp. Leaf267]
MDKQEQTEDSGQRGVQSAEVGGRLLLALAGQPGAMTLKDLAAAAGMPPSRAHPYLVSFGKLRLIEQDAAGHYALGAAALQLGLTCLYQLDPVKAAVPVAEELARTTGYAVALAVWGNFGATIVRMIDARQPLHVSMRAGTVMSLLGTATGRAFAAVLPQEKLDHAIGGPLGEPEAAGQPMNAQQREELRTAIAEMQAHGVARANGRPMPGVNAFSAAAFDHEGVPAIVITSLGHQDHFPAGWDSGAAQAVRAAAAEISRRLGFSGPSAASPWAR